MSNETFYTLIVAVLSSSLLAAAFTSIVTGFFSVFVKGKEYENDYFKEVIKRRLEAYEFIDAQISMLKGSAVDDDSKAYHLMFAYGEDKFYEYQQNLNFAVAKSVWVDRRTKDILVELNRLFLQIGVEYDLQKNLIEAGKAHYQEIAMLRHRLENSFSSDLKDLHKVKKFLNQKSKEAHEFQITLLKHGKDDNSPKNET